MPMQSLSPMLAAAADRGYAVPQFNVDNVEIAQAVLAAAEAARAPVILAVGQAVDRASRMEPLAAAIRCMAERTTVPVCLHLDHSEHLPQIARAIQAGFTGIMIDASALPLSVNISTTAGVIEYCSQIGAGVEAELGRIAGVEDDLDVSLKDAGKVDVDIVAQFLADVRPDALAVAVGTAHGFYDAPPHIDFDLIEAVQRLSPPPLVLHGGTGLPDDVIDRAVKAGIAKINFATELRKSFVDAITDSGVSGSSIFDVISAGQIAVRQVAEHKLQLLRTSGRA